MKLVFGSWVGQPPEPIRYLLAGHLLVLARALVGLVFRILELNQATPLTLPAEHPLQERVVRKVSL
jgi:hypothetical protein